MIKKLLTIVVLVGVAYAGFRWGPVFFPAMERVLGVGPPAAVEEELGPTPEMAEATLDLFEEFRAGEIGDRLALGGTELSSILRYAMPGIIPPGVSQPTVDLEDGKVHVSARVAVDAFPRLPRLDQILGLLPDTILIEMRGSLISVDQGVLALQIDRVQAANIPIPSRMVAGGLDGLGRQGPASLPEDALIVPMPDGLESIFVQRDSLVLLAKNDDESAQGEGN
ncbi:MAG: hypothetical protein HN396_03655 [Gemmatimonadales bacterium]|nr:hypothetical protein [Gemmatimonadales bacterium]